MPIVGRELRSILNQLHSTSHFAIFRQQGDNNWRGGVAIGDQIIDLLALASHHPFTEQADSALKAAAEPTLNHFMSFGLKYWSELRLALSQSLGIDSPLKSIVAKCLVPQSTAEFNLPCHIGEAVATVLPTTTINAVTGI